MEAGVSCPESGIRRRVGRAGWREEGRRDPCRPWSVCGARGRHTQAAVRAQSELQLHTVYNITTITQHIADLICHIFLGKSPLAKVIVDALKGQFNPKSGINEIVMDEGLAI